jgi:hypothetical protein
MYHLLTDRPNGFEFLHPGVKPDSRHILLEHMNHLIEQRAALLSMMEQYEFLVSSGQLTATPEGAYKLEMIRHNYKLLTNGE